MGWGLWLRYPLSAPSTAVYSAKGEGAEDDKDLFYYIKKGVEAELLYWDSSGNARLIQAGAHSGHVM